MMRVSYPVLLTCCCLLAVIAPVGRTASRSSARTVVYQPTVPPGMTWADAVNVLLTTLNDPSYMSAGIRCTIENNGIAIMNVSDGRMITQFAFYQLLGHSVVVSSSAGRGPYFVTLPGLFEFSGKDRARAEKVADALHYMQQHLKSYRDKLEAALAKFEPVAARYRSLETKPPLSEELRKLIVQANAMTEKKNYLEAREKYRKVIELDPTAYPAAYYNLALLEAQMNLPFAAVTYMKHYLFLAPDVQDARSAQDKIYEWEMLLPESLATINITTDPPDALVETKISDSDKGWVYLGRAPQVARFGDSDAKGKSCLIRASKPGYATEEKSFAFESLVPQVHIALRPSGSGRDSHGYLGIHFVQMTEELATSVGLETIKGVAVKAVAKGGPGDRAKLQPGDIILAIEGKEIDEAIDLPHTAASTPIGKAVQLSIWRKGQPQTVTIKIGKLPK